MVNWFIALLLGFILDLILGDPEWLYHPVCIIGKFISHLEKRLRARGGNLRVSAVILTAFTVIVTMGVVEIILDVLGLFGRVPLIIGMALLDWMALAVKSRRTRSSSRESPNWTSGLRVTRS